MNHTSLAERSAAAASFLSSWPAFAELVRSTYIDEMDNAATIAFGLWPERFLLLNKGVVAWASTLSDQPPGSLSQELSQAAQNTFAQV